MRVLLVGRVPALFENQRGKGEEFPAFQAQTFWLAGLRKAGNKVRVFRYSDGVFLPTKLAAAMEAGWSRRWPGGYVKYRLAKNRFYYLFLDNYVRSWRLTRLVEDFEPEVIIFSSAASELVGWGLGAAKKRGIKIVLIRGEDPRRSITEFEKNNLDLFDWVVTGNEQHARAWKKLGAKRAKSVPYMGIDPSTHKKLALNKKEREEYGAEVVFVGSLFPERQKLLAQLLEFDLKVWGVLPVGIELDRRLKPVYQGEAFGEKMVKIFNAGKIVLNFVPDHLAGEGNMRSFEIAGCGALQAANSCNPSWFEIEKEIVLFDDVTDLKKKLRYYLTRPKLAAKIGQRAYRRAHGQYTYEQRFETILKLI